MSAQMREWKRALDQLWSATEFDCGQAARLAAEMTRSEEARLREVAAQALPSLRGALLKGAGRGARELARRRLGAVRDVLHALDAPRFGKRASGEAMPTPEERHRRLLGLPLGRRLFGPEIHQAYKRAAKKLHPDAGGTERDFLELSNARDALMPGGGEAPDVPQAQSHVRPGK